MGVDTAIKERRRHKRFSVEGNAIAVIQQIPTIILGQIKDISLGGLSFSYMNGDDRPDESTSLDIFLPDDKRIIKGVTFQTITDSIIFNDNPFSTVIMNRRGVRFRELTDRLETEIEYIIQKLAREDLETGYPISSIKNLGRLLI